MTASAENRLVLSVIIAASNDLPSLERCLLSLEPQGKADDTEVIVASNYADGVSERLNSQFSYVKHISLPKTATVPELRTAGMNMANGEIIALLEDHCFFHSDWCAEIKRAHESVYDVIGGAVENASVNRPVDWAVYLYEYGKYMLPLNAGITDALAGNNVSYKRAILEQLKTQYTAGFFETFINNELRDAGNSLYLSPSAIVYHRKNYRVKETLIQCFHHGRLFAGKRTEQAGIAKRLKFILGSVILPVLLPGRILLRAWQKGRCRKELLRAVPLLLLFMTSWSFGEFCGYTFGAGASASKWT